MSYSESSVTHNIWPAYSGLKADCRIELTGILDEHEGLDIR
jgi:hypothetical protein